jgi:hypothetical protein
MWCYLKKSDLEKVAVILAQTTYIKDVLAASKKYFYK